MTRTASTCSTHLLLDFVRDFVLADDNSEELSKSRKAYERLLEQARQLRSELERIEEEQRELSSRAGDGDDVFPWLFKTKAGSSAETQAELETLRKKSSSVEKNLEELAPQIDAAKQRLDFLTEEYRNRLGDYLNQPENARRLFGAHRSAATIPPEKRRQKCAHSFWKSGFIAWKSAIFCSTCSRAMSCERSMRIIARPFTCSN